MSEDKHAIRVWDLPTRAFHWLLAVLVLLQYGTAQWHWLSMDWHFRFGYAILVLLIFRVAWGFMGSRTSRFVDFVRGPRSVLRFLRNGLSDRARTAGHNPLGGWSVLAFLLCLTVQAGTGLFASDDITLFGPLNARVSESTASWLTSIHKLNQYVLLALIAAHVAAVLLHYVIKQDNLVAPMLHGRKRLQAPAPRMAPWWPALIVLVLAALAVWALVAWGEAASAF